MKLLKSKLSVAVTMAVFGAALAACGGHHHHGSSNGGGDEGTTGNTADWAVASTSESGKALVKTIPATIEDTCVIDNGTIAVSGDVWEKYGAWIWDPNNENANLYDGTDDDCVSDGKCGWPGKDITQTVVAGCTTATIRNILPPEAELEVAVDDDEDDEDETVAYKSIDGYSIIINNLGDGAQTADLKSLSEKNNCVSLIETDAGVIGELVSARECGVQLKDGSVSDADVKTEVYAYLGTTKLNEGDQITISEKSGKEDSKTVDVVLLIKGIGVTESTKGVYWFNSDEAGKVEFTNGETVTLGSGFELEDGQEVKGVLHVQYTPTDAEGNALDPVEASYNVSKTYTEKDDEARQTKQEQTLGATYTAEKTTFRIWSPDSSDVKINVDGTDYEMKKVALDGYGKVYEVAVDGDLAGKTYQFSIGGKKVRDPYGKMVAKGSDTANIVMDMSQTEPDGGWADAPALKNREDAVVYEVHVRDFTIDETSGVDADKRGRYLGMVQTGTTNGELATGIDHLKELGVTHVQLQPIYDYATCSGVDSQDSSCYNWGYDPWNYNVPEDRYSSVFGTDKYNEKIKEVKTMVNEFHKNGIRVIMDVVYNHTYDKTVFEDITKKYYTGENDLSGCGNAIDGDNNLVWMMIRDSMDYWVTEYHIDGFRLDLVGVFGIKDFSDWGKYLNAQHPNANLLIYGEPWTGGGDSSVITDPVRTGRMWMQDADAHVGAFNNKYRNCLKSASDSGKSAGTVSKLGFIFNHDNTDWDGNGTDENGNNIVGNKNCVFMGMKAGVRTKDAPNEVKDEWSAQGFSDPEQTITYITAHDNLALRDKIEDASIDGVSLYTTDAERKTIQVYANSALMVSQGITFIHGGEEIGRTKAAAGTSGESPMWNTYKTTSGANDFKWDLKSEWKDVFESYAAYIKMRKDHPAFRMTTADLINANVTLDEASTDEIVIVNIDGTKVGDKWGAIKVVLNSTTSAVSVDGVSSMTKVADGVTVNEDGLTNDGKAAASAVSIWMTPNDSAGPVNFPALFLIGNITGWSSTLPLTYDASTGNWSVSNVVLTEGSEFKFQTVDGSWDDPNYGSESGSHDLVQTNTNVKPGVDGTCTILVSDADKTWDVDCE